MRSHESYVQCGRKGAISKWSKQPPFEERFWTRVKIGGLDECWPWKSGISKKTGYGKCKLNGKHTNSHRVAFILSRGPIPEGKQVLHTCDNRPCCNPAHLFCGSHQDNMDDMVAKGRQNRPIGDAHHNRKLSHYDVLEIRELLKIGTTHASISKIYGVSRGTIYAISSGKSWSHM